MKRILFYLLLLVPAFLASCTNEELDTNRAGDKNIILHIGLGTNKSSTRALNDDSSIADFYLFAFEEEDGQYVYAYTPQINSWETGKINITARTSDKKQLLLILANAHNEAIKVRPQYGETFDAISRRFEIKLDERWPADGENRLIPMCAIADDLIINEATTSLKSKTNTPFELVRMLARIDIVLNEEITSDWTLEEVFLYRPGKSGWLVYNPANEYWDANAKPNHAKKAFARLITEFPEHDENRYRYETPTDNKISLTNTIYTFETVATAKRMTTTAIVVGLKPVSENDIQYYRIDIKKNPYNQDTEVYKTDIVRNVLYDITINSVTTLGADDADTAYAGEGYIVNAFIKTWTKARQSVIGDGKYTLSLDKDEMSFVQAETTQTLTATTDYDITSQGYTGGISATVPLEYRNWLSIPTSSGSASDMERTFSVRAQANTTNAERTGEIYITVGNLTKIVQVVQKRTIATRFARSNIVWDDINKRLTFAVTAEDNINIPANVQGVFFKWGSLFPLSPVGQTFDVPSQVLFTPEWYEETPPSGTGADAWRTIPFMFAGSDYEPPFNNGDEDEDDFLTYNGGRGYDVKIGKGDICRYISDKKWVEGRWRLPTAQEQIFLTNEYSSVTNGGSFEDIGSVPDENKNAYGYYHPLSGRWFGIGMTGKSSDSETTPSDGVVYFPASGRRDYNYGIANYTGCYGNCWSGSSYNYSIASAWSLQIQKTNSGRSGDYTWTGFPVRCIRVNE